MLNILLAKKNEYKSPTHYQLIILFMLNLEEKRIQNCVFL